MNLAVCCFPGCAQLAAPCGRPSPACPVLISSGDQSSTLARLGLPFPGVLTPPAVSKLQGSAGLSCPVRFQTVFSPSTHARFPGVLCFPVRPTHSCRPLPDPAVPPRRVSWGLSAGTEATSNLREFPLQRGCVSTFFCYRIRTNSTLTFLFPTRRGDRAEWPLPDGGGLNVMRSVAASQVRVPESSVLGCQHSGQGAGPFHSILYLLGAEDMNLGALSPRGLGSGLRVLSEGNIPGDLGWPPREDSSPGPSPKPH